MSVADLAKEKPMHSFPIPRKLISFIVCFIVGGLIWFAPVPSGLDPKAWHLFAVFVFTILGLISKFMPVGAIVLFSVSILTLSKTLTFREAFSGFGNETVWLIVLAFFIARGFIKTGLGLRIAYNLMGVLGKSTLGMAYGMAFTDFLLAPAIPSVTARAGGVVYPVVTSLSRAFESYPDKSPSRMGAYLVQTVFQCGAVTSAMFLTAMAGNPMVQNFAENVGVKITWASWALAALVPGMVSLFLIPLILYKLYPPQVKSTPEARNFAKEKLKELGRISQNEWIMIFAFLILISLWALAPIIAMSATVTALFGLTLLLITQVLSWEDVLKEKGAWDTLIWFATLVSMATALNQFGLMRWFSDNVVHQIGGFHWLAGFAILGLLYFYSHYFFASNVAHITVMYPPFLLLAVGIGTPPALAALVLGFASSLFGPLTTYGCGPAPIYFGSGYVKIGDWWKLGFIVSLVNIAVWVIIGSVWWNLLGLF